MKIGGFEVEIRRVSDHRPYPVIDRGHTGGGGAGTRANPSSPGDAPGTSATAASASDTFSVAGSGLAAAAGAAVGCKGGPCVAVAPPVVEPLEPSAFVIVTPGEEYEIWIRVCRDECPIELEPGQVFQASVAVDGRLQGISAVFRPVDVITERWQIINMFPIGTAGTVAALAAFRWAAVGDALGSESDGSDDGEPSPSLGRVTVDISLRKHTRSVAVGSRRVAYAAPRGGRLSAGAGDNGEFWRQPSLASEPGTIRVGTFPRIRRVYTMVQTLATFSFQCETRATLALRGVLPHGESVAAVSGRPSRVAASSATARAGQKRRRSLEDVDPPETSDASSWVPVPLPKRGCGPTPLSREDQ